MTLLFWFTLALVGAPAVALAAPQIPEDFRGTWCVDRELTAGVASGPCSELSGANFEAEITATNVSIPDIPLSCVVRHVTKFDVCPWGMIFKNRKRALALRSFQINPWSPGYHIVFQCTGKASETMKVDWVIEKGYIRGGLEREYRCPWAR